VEEEIKASLGLQVLPLAQAARHAEKPQYRIIQWADLVLVFKGMSEGISWALAIANGA
jgi:hypothetical protein